MPSAPAKTVINCSSVWEHEAVQALLRSSYYPPRMRGPRTAPDYHATNEDLLIAVASGDRAAFRNLYDAAAPLLFSICLRMLRDRDAARDALQEVFFRIWQKAYLYDQAKGSALAWMTTITRRSVLDRLAATRRPMLSLDEIDEALVSQAPSALGRGSVEAVNLRRCLEQLNKKFSRAILMAYFYGLTHEELSTTLGVPLGTAKSWVNRGVAQLQRCMGE